MTKLGYAGRHSSHVINAGSVQTYYNISVLRTCVILFSGCRKSWKSPVHTAFGEAIFFRKRAISRSCDMTTRWKLVHKRNFMHRIRIWYLKIVNSPWSKNRTFSKNIEGFDSISATITKKSLRSIKKEYLPHWVTKNPIFSLKNLKFQISRPVKLSSQFLDTIFGFYAQNYVYLPIFSLQWLYSF